jgi:DNA-binding transcriptional MerR regulator
MLPRVMKTGTNLSNYLRIREAAFILGVHPDTLRRWSSLSKLITFRHPVNRYRLYRRTDIEELLNRVKSP